MTNSSPRKALVWRGGRPLASLLAALILVCTAACDGENPTPNPTPVPPAAPPPAPTPPPAPPPEPPAPAVLESISLSESTVFGQARPVATLKLSAAAPTGGATILLDSTNEAAVRVPQSVSIPAGQTTNNFVIDTSTVRTRTEVGINAKYAGVSVSALLTVLPPSLGASFTVNSPSKGADACSIINAGGAIDCQFDASRSEGFVASYRWTFRVGEKEFNAFLPEGNPVYTPQTDCSILSGAMPTSSGIVPMLVILRVQDREGNQSSPTQRTVEISPNGFCGY